VIEPAEGIKPVDIEFSGFEERVRTGRFDDQAADLFVALAKPFKRAITEGKE
jgi:hypothetical protein